MAGYEVNFVAADKWTPSWKPFDRIDVYSAPTPERSGRDQRRVGSFSPRFPGEWTQDRRSPTAPVVRLDSALPYGSYELVGLDGGAESFVASLEVGPTPSVSGGPFASVTVSASGVVMPLLPPDDDETIYSRYVPRDHEAYDVRIAYVDDDGRGVVVSDHSTVRLESMDSCATVSFVDGGYVYTPVSDGTATLRAWSQDRGATYFEVTAYTPFFRDNWERFFSGHDVAKAGKGPFRALVGVLMEFLDALWACDADVASFGDPRTVRYRFLENFGQSVGFTEMLSVNKGREAEALYARLYRELVAQMFGIQAGRGSEAIYSTFFSAIGYDIELLEFWFDDDGNLVEVNPHDDSKSSYAVYSRDGRMLRAAADVDPRERVVARSKTDPADVRNKSWYVLPRLTPKDGRSYPQEFEPVVKQYLDFLRPLHVEYLQTVSTLSMSAFASPDRAPRLSDVVAVTRFLSASKGAGFDSFHAAAPVTFKRVAQIFQPEFKHADRRNVRVFVSCLGVSAKAHRVWMPGMPSICDNSVSPPREWSSMHANWETRSGDFRSTGYNAWEHPGGVSRADYDASVPRTGSSYVTHDGTVLPRGGGMANDILYRMHDQFMIVKYVGIADHVFGRPKYDRGLKYDDAENRVTYDSYSQIAEKFAVTRVQV